MEPIKRILAATDFSPLGNAAVERAAMLAAGHNAALRVVHAFPKPGVLEALVAAGDGLPARLQAAAREHLDQLIRRAAAASVAATIEAEVVEGKASQVIATAAAGFSPDLVVIGAHARGSVRQFFLGGTASRVLSRSRAPVLVVRQPAQSHYARVLAAVNLGPDSARVVDAARMLSREGAITVAHACQPPFDSRLHDRGDSAAQLELLGVREAEKAMERMKALLAAHMRAGSELQARVVRGHPNPVLFDLASEIHADLIVALRHNGSRLEEDIMGSIARLLAYNAPCDVLLA
jgi:universal stress protein E